MRASVMKDGTTILTNIEWIRALASLAVVAVHYPVLAFPADLGNFTLASWFIGYVLRLAVPMFMIVAAFLFAAKQRDSAYLRTKIKQLIFLALVWPMLFYVLNAGIGGYVRKLIDTGKLLAENPILLPYFVFSNLETVYYFFISLAIMLYMTYILLRLSTQVVLVVQVVTLTIVAALPFLAGGDWAMFYNPLNFLVFAPAGILINRNLDKILLHKIAWGSLILSAGLIGMFIELTIASRYRMTFIDGYSKASLVFIASGILCVSMSTRPVNFIIRFMSQQSLPLYLLHTCLFSLIGTVSSLVLSKALHVPDNLFPSLRWVTAVLLSYCISVLLVPWITSTRLMKG